MMEPAPKAFEASETFAGALRMMADKAFILTPRYKEKQWVANRKDCHADILEFERRFVAKAKKMDIPLYAHCIRRGRAEQTDLFVMGRSKAKYGQSPHNYGMAVDMLHCRFNWQLDKKAWSVLGHVGGEIAKQAGINIEWGGNWDFYDPAHWQLAHWKEMVSGYK